MDRGFAGPPVGAVSCGHLWKTGLLTIKRAVRMEGRAPFGQAHFSCAVCWRRGKGGRHLVCYRLADLRLLVREITHQ